MNVQNNDKTTELINKKKKRSLTLKKLEANQDKIPPKKAKSAENNKKEDIETFCKFKNFMAMIDTSNKIQSFEGYNKIKGNDLSLEYRQQEAVKLINSISLKNGKEINLEIIEKSLIYDNTNIYVIFKALKYYLDIKDESLFQKAINNYKHCITKIIKIIENKKEQEINLNSLYNINIPLCEFVELPGNKKNLSEIIDLRNSLVELFTNYYYISEFYKEVYIHIEKNDLKEIFKIKYESDSTDSQYKLRFENDSKKKILIKYKNKCNKAKLDEILIFIENFLSKYLFIKELDHFNNNQPINFQKNLILYYNYIMYSLYYLVIGINETKKFIFFKEEKLLIYRTLSKFHDLIFDDCFDKELPIDIIITQFLNLLLLTLSYNGMDKTFESIIDLIHSEKIKGEKFLDVETGRNLAEIINKKYETSLGAYISGDKIILTEFLNNTFEIKYSNYSVKLLDYAKLGKEYFFTGLWHNTKFEVFQEQNFFCPEDINYLKYLIKHILCSNLFKTIFTNFNNISDFADYYFGNTKNVEDYIKRIIFLPFNTTKYGKYAITDRRALYIIISGFPQKTISSILYYKLFRIIELALRVLILTMHEPSHFIKSAYNLLSNGVISRETSKTYDQDAEGGFLLEEVFLGWVKEKKSPLNLKNFHLQEINCNNKMISQKRIDLVTALKLLDPAIYNKDLFSFRKSIFEVKVEDLKNFNYSNLEKTYHNYLKSVIDEESIRKIPNNNNDLFINASMGSNCGLFLDYYGGNFNNHNIK